MEVPEHIILLTQKEVYSLIDKQKLLDDDVIKAHFALEAAINDSESNRKNIKQCTHFLQEHCPDAVKGTWYQELCLEKLGIEE